MRLNNKLITLKFSIVIFRIAQKIHRNLPEKVLSFEEYPNLDMGGKESIKINPALELIKAICKVTILLSRVYLLINVEDGCLIHRGFLFISENFRFYL